MAYQRLTTLRASIDGEKNQNLSTDLNPSFRGQKNLFSSFQFDVRNHYEMIKKSHPLFSSLHAQKDS